MRSFGPYQVHGPLGRGGMATVWRAQDPRTGAWVAIKSVEPEAELSDALRREIVSLAALRDPGVVRLLDHALDDDPPWLVMDLVAGRSLRQAWGSFERQTVGFDVVADPWAAEPVPVDAPTRLAPLGPLAATLARLHGQGLAHRDLKPENVVLTSDGRPVLVDFGLAQSTGARDRESLGDGGRSRGTPGYVAPEVLAGRVSDRRVDLYALGCLILEAITGTPPAPSDDGPAELQRALSEALPGLPAALAAVVARTLEPDPEQRTAWADQVAVALGEPPVAVRATTLRPRWHGPRPRVQGAPVCVIVGPQGSGRSRTLREFADDERALVAVASTGDGELASVASALCVAFDRAGAEVRSAVGPVLAHLGVPGGDQAPIPLPPPAAAARARAAAVSLLADCAGWLLVDDAEHADPETLEVLRALARGAAADLRVAVATTGPGAEALLAAGAARWEVPAWDAEGLRHVARSALVDPPEEVVAWATRGATGPAQVVARLGAAARTGHLLRTGGAWVARALPEGEPLAPHAGVPGHDLADAVARGRSFPVRGLGDRLVPLAGLVLEHVLELAGDRLAFPSEAAWRAAATSAAEQLPAAHARLATLATRPDQVAAHLEAAGDLGGAARSWLDAARAADRDGRTSAAFAAAGRAMACGAHGHEARLIRARAAADIGQVEEAEQLALELGGDPALAPDVGWVLSRVRSAQGRTQEALDALVAPDPDGGMQRVQALRRLGRGAEAEEVLAMNQASEPLSRELAVAELMRERGEAHAAFDRLTDFVRLHPPPESRAAEVALALATLAEHDVARALPYAEAALTASRRIGDLQRAASAAQVLGTLLGRAGRPMDGFAVLDAAIVQRVQLGQMIGEAAARGAWANLSATTGLELDRGAREAAEARRIFESAPLPLGVAAAGNALGLILEQSGRWREAAAAFSDAVAHAERHGLVAVADVARENAAMLWLALGDLEKARDAGVGGSANTVLLYIAGELERAEAEALALLDEWFTEHERVYVALCRIALDRGDREALARWVAQLQDTDAIRFLWELAPEDPDLRGRSVAWLEEDPDPSGLSVWCGLAATGLALGTPDRAELAARARRVLDRHGVVPFELLVALAALAPREAGELEREVARQRALGVDPTRWVSRYLGVARGER